MGGLCFGFDDSSELSSGECGGTGSAAQWSPGERRRVAPGNGATSRSPRAGCPRAARQDASFHAPRPALPHPAPDAHPPGDRMVARAVPLCPWPAASSVVHVSSGAPNTAATSSRSRPRGQDAVRPHRLMYTRFNDPESQAFWIGRRRKIPGPSAEPRTSLFRRALLAHQNPAPHRRTTMRLIGEF